MQGTGVYQLNTEEFPVTTKLEYKNVSSPKNYNSSIQRLARQHSFDYYTISTEAYSKEVEPLLDPSPLKILKIIYVTQCQKIVRMVSLVSIHRNIMNPEDTLKSF